MKNLFQKTVLVLTMAFMGACDEDLMGESDASTAKLRILNGNLGTEADAGSCDPEVSDRTGSSGSPAVSGLSMNSKSTPNPIPTSVFENGDDSNAPQNHGSMGLNGGEAEGRFADLADQGALIGLENGTDGFAPRTVFSAPDGVLQLNGLSGSTSTPYFFLNHNNSTDWYLRDNAGVFQIDANASSAPVVQVRTTSVALNKEVQIRGTESSDTQPPGDSNLAVGTLRLKGGNAQYMFLDGNEIDVYSSNSPYYGTNLYIQDNARSNVVLCRAGGVVQIGGNIGSDELAGYKLVVQGAIKATSISIEEIATADYVFSDDYELMPIEEVSRFVDENQHLPGIASASKMKADGLNLGEFQGQLLKKIEELTLYTIEQEKKIDRLETVLEKAGFTFVKGQNQ